MNDRFFTLPTDRQKAIVNAALRVFAGSDYKHASMSAVAEAGGISKSLLFHYFDNKQGLYMFLWKFAAAATARATADFGAQETRNPFELFRRVTKAKCSIMRTHPYLYAFSTAAYYETDPAVQELVQQDIARYAEDGQAMFEQLVDPACLAPNVNPTDLYTDFLMLSDGYMLQKYRSGLVDADAIEADFEAIIGRWERLFGRGAQ